MCQKVILASYFLVELEQYLWLHCSNVQACSLFVQVLLLDEITVDLDVLARADLLTFLRKECEERGATIIYATHIFDGLENWPTNIVRPCSISDLFLCQRFSFILHHSVNALLSGLCSPWKAATSNAYGQSQRNQQIVTNGQCCT